MREAEEKMSGAGEGVRKLGVRVWTVRGGEGREWGLNVWMRSIEEDGARTRRRTGRRRDAEETQERSR